jgi:hypothetical protein
VLFIQQATSHHFAALYLASKKPLSEGKSGKCLDNLRAQELVISFSVINLDYLTDTIYSAIFLFGLQRALTYDLCRQMVCGCFTAEDDVDNSTAIQSEWQENDLKRKKPSKKAKKTVKSQGKTVI